MALVRYITMISQYPKILQYHWLSKLKQQFISDLQQVFYDPLLASAATKHIAQWKTTTTEIKTKKNTETTTTMPFPDQDPMVQSSMRLQCLGHALVSRRRIERQRQRRCRRGDICIYALEDIYPMNTL